MVQDSLMLKMHFKHPLTRAVVEISNLFPIFHRLLKVNRKIPLVKIEKTFILN